MELKVGMTLDTLFEEGVVIDYVDGQWIILVKDEKWVEEEQTGFRRNRGLFSFYPLDTVVFFLVNIDDMLETSDLPFMIQDCDEAEALIQSQGSMEVKIGLIGGNNEILSVRSFSLATKEADQVRFVLTRIRTQNFEESVSLNQIEKTQLRSQPFEMEEKAAWQFKF